MSTKALKHQVLSRSLAGDEGKEVGAWWRMEGKGYTPGAVSKAWGGKWDMERKVPSLRPQDSHGPNGNASTYSLGVTLKKFSGLTNVMNVPRLAQLGPSRLVCASVTVNKGASELLVPTELWSGGARNILSQILPSSIKDENGVLTGEMVKIFDRMTFNLRPEADKPTLVRVSCNKETGVQGGGGRCIYDPLI